MDSNIEVRILLEDDVEALYNFAREQMQRDYPDAVDLELRTWTARWRVESLSYYLPQGWSFGAFTGGRLRGFLLGQPLLFFRGLTQTLWIEDLVFDSPAVAGGLLDVAYKWARDKHLQCVLLEGTAARSKIVQEWKHARQTDEPMIELRSARF